MHVFIERHLEDLYVLYDGGTHFLSFEICTEPKSHQQLDDLFFISSVKCESGKCNLAG